MRLSRGIMNHATREIYLWLLAKDKSSIIEVVQFETETGVLNKKDIEIRIVTGSVEYRYYLHQGDTHVC